MTATVDSSGSAAPRARAQTTNGHGAPFTTDVESADTKNPSLQASAESEQQAKEILKLRNTVELMDCLSQNGFSQIKSIAWLARASLETPDGFRHLDNIVNALEAIVATAEKTQDSVNSEAEEVGCNYVDGTQRRRYAARRAYQKDFLAAPYATSANAKGDAA